MKMSQMLMIGRTKIQYITVIFIFYSSQWSSNPHQLQVTPPFPSRIFTALPIHGGRQTSPLSSNSSAPIFRFRNRCLGDSDDDIMIITYIYIYISFVLVVFQHYIQRSDRKRVFASRIELCPKNFGHGLEWGLDSHMGDGRPFFGMVGDLSFS